MLEEAYELERYLPVSYKTQTESDYIAFLWGAFQSNCENGKYQFAFLAYHMLTMCFVYFNVWQIRHARANDFEKGLIGFGRDVERDLLKATTPFSFSIVNERSILRFLRLINCDNGKIGTYAKLVDDRNSTAHANGNIFYTTEAALSEKVSEVLRVVDEIQGHSKCVIEECYRSFLLSSLDPEEREHMEPADQVREVLVHGHYLSMADIAYCREFDASQLQPQAEVSSLHEALRSSYPSE